MSINQLVEKTEEFFVRHWTESSIGETAPKWSSPWKFIGSIENGDKVGCYALFSGENLIYVGVAESGLGSRTNAYTRVSPSQSSGEDRVYVPAPEWGNKQLTHMYTIAFPKNYWYLSSALEKYLIRMLQPKENVNGK